MLQHFIRLIHQINQRIHRFVHLAVVQAAHVEEVVLKGFRAHPRELTHALRRIAQDDPARLFDADVVVHLLGIQLVISLHPVLGDVAELIAVVAAAHADVAIHLVHESGVALRPNGEHLVGRALQKFALHLALRGEHKGHPARRVHRLDKERGELRVRARDVDPDLVAALHAAGIVDQIVRKSLLPCIMYHISLPPAYIIPLFGKKERVARSFLLIAESFTLCRCSRARPRSCGGRLCAPRLSRARDTDGGRSERG